MPLNPDLLDQLRAANTPPSGEIVASLGDIAASAANEYDQTPEGQALQFETNKLQEVQRVQAKLTAFASRLCEDNPDVFKDFESSWTVQYSEADHTAYIHQLDPETKELVPEDNAALYFGRTGLKGELSIPSEFKVTGFYCEDNELTSLPELPKSLIKLTCYDNKLTSLPELPESLIKLYCYDNKLTSLPELPKSLTWLYCYDNKLTSLPELPKSLIKLYCYDNKLTSLPELPKSLIKLTCYDNKLTSLPELPESLRGLYCYNNKLASLPELPESLRGLYCYNNKLASLPELPKSLKWLYCYNNKLTSLPELPKYLRELISYSNPLPQKAIDKANAQVAANQARLA
jgi:hypothetical protein